MKKSRALEQPSREPARARKIILEAACKEFSANGFAGARIDEIASRAKVSKQLIVHHFKSKERLYFEVYEILSQPSLQWEDYLSDDPGALMADRFLSRIPHLEHVRLLTWEAAGIRNRALPGEGERQERITRFGRSIRLLQDAGRLPKGMNYRMLHLAIIALANYPLAFSEGTRLITGHSGMDPRFHRKWTKFLRQLGKVLLTAVERK
ncbi:MAG: hypothetical protein A3G24_19670 [Betaproteobacteria bacterium RIFCSPLOWO2_12_FULL_62_13]|nr:MAG: hypothetical protein A3G24_19670 [Betaproteobacteria bacterium RIFCSPLOWO2_12_FULL_62_13]